MVHSVDPDWSTKLISSATSDPKETDLEKYCRSIGRDNVNTSVTVCCTLDSGALSRTCYASAFGSMDDEDGSWKIVEPSLLSKMA